jgi:hypothetical protein
MQQQYHFVWYGLPVLLTALASVLYGLLKKFIDPAARFHRTLRFLQLVLFAALGGYYMANGSSLDAVFLFLWAAGWFFLVLSERHLFGPVLVQFTDGGVLIPGALGRRQLSWSDLADVAVRPDYITIFKNDNHFLQFEVAQAAGNEALEELALFCKQRLRWPAPAAVNE